MRVCVRACVCLIFLFLFLFFCCEISNSFFFFLLLMPFEFSGVEIGILTGFAIQLVWFCDSTGG